ncbi:MAG: restriction endonuclease subunit S [Clostridia bacterium]|nr:restriction endonuclease subunit S [Clostridia bacterium]
MSKIYDLLKNEKVEWKKLGDVAAISKGKQLNKRDMLEDGEYPVINGGVSTSGYIDMFNSEENTITVSQGGASAGFVNFIEQKFWLGAHAFSVIPDDDIIKTYGYEYDCFNRLLFHILKMNQIYLQDSKVGAGIPSVSKDELSNIEIPLTSKNTQEKIVKTLDKFTNYVTELQSELQSRNAQYEYYRDMLLSEEYLNQISDRICNFSRTQYELRNLLIEDIVKIRNGKDWKTLKQGDIPVYGSGGKMDVYVDKYSYDKPTVLIPRKGSIENVFYLEEPFWNVDTIFYTEIDDTQIIPKYFYYFIENYDLSQLSINPTRPSLTQSTLNKIKIKLPPIEIQNKVVEILDEFQSLLVDTKGLLPEEIEKRQKQYEYYREKLLTFDINSETILDRQTDRQIISDAYFVLLKEAADIVGVKLFDGEWKSLGEFCKCYDGTHQTPKYTNGGIPFVSVQNIKNIYGTDKFISIEAFNEYKIKPRKDDLFMTRIGDIGTCALVENNENLAYYVTLTLLRPNQNVVLSKFLKYLIESKHGKKELDKRTLHMANPIKINLGEIPKLRFFVPPIIVQEYIVAILDRFDALINDVSKGIPKEIELRQKQYEYYREKVLHFERE